MVSPIGAAGSPERIHADWLLEGIIIPVFAAYFDDYQVIRADKMPAPGMIDSQIIEHLLDAELVIADITTLNPNVFYEIGIRHVAQKPIVHMNLEGSPIPFDIKIFKHIEFSLKTPQSLESAKVALKGALGSVFHDDFKVDNPVTRTRGKMDFEKTASPQEKVMQSQIDELSQRLFTIESGRTNRARSPVVKREEERHYRYVVGGRAHESLNPDIKIKVFGTALISTRQLYEAVEEKAKRFFPNFAMSDFGGGEDNVIFSVPIATTNMDAVGDFQRELVTEGFKVVVY